MDAADPSGEVDLAVVGAGIIGLAVAREALRRRPGLRVAVLEREHQVATHQTGRNSGVIHAGVYYAPGSLKARLCVEGARSLYEYCDGHGIPAARSGKLIVAVKASELPRLDELERRGRLNGVPGLRRLSGRELEAVEPNARGLAGLHSPATGTVDFAAVARSLAAEVTAAGCVVSTGSGVSGITPHARGLRLRHPGGETRATIAVFCAGAWSDRLAVAAGAEPSPRVVPFRGAYLKLRPGRGDLVQGLIYPVPDPALPFLGVHLTRQASGEVLLGPSALLSPTREPGAGWGAATRDLRDTLTWPGTWRLAARHWRAGLSEVGSTLSRRAVARQAARYVPGITAKDLEPSFTGVRAQALGRDGALLDDFLVSETERALHVRNAPSPAATSALALASLMVDRLERRADWRPAERV